MKMILKGLLVVLVVMMGTSLYTSSKMNRVSYLFREEAVPDLAEGKIDSYVDKTMVMIGNHQYITKPVHKFKASNNFDFNFDIYHFQSIYNKVPESGLQFYLYNFTEDNFIDLIDDSKAYKDNKDLVRVRIRVNTDKSNNLADLIFPLHETTSKNESFQTNGSTANSIYLNNNDNTSYFTYANNDKTTITFKEIRSLEFFIEDATKEKNNKFNPIKIGEIFGNSEVDFYEEINLATNANDQFVLDGVKLLASDYSELSKLYTNEPEKVTTADLNALKTYNYLITRTVVIYAVTATIVLFLVIFLKPLRNLIATKKQIKELEK